MITINLGSQSNFGASFSADPLVNFKNDSALYAWYLPYES